MVVVVVSNMHLPIAEVALATGGAVGDAREEAAAADTRRRSSIVEDFIVLLHKIASWHTRRAWLLRDDVNEMEVDELSFFCASFFSTTRSRRRKADGLGVARVFFFAGVTVFFSLPHTTTSFTLSLRTDNPALSPARGQ